MGRGDSVMGKKIGPKGFDDTIPLDLGLRLIFPHLSACTFVDDNEQRGKYTLRTPEGDEGTVGVECVKSLYELAQKLEDEEKRRKEEEFWVLD